MPSTVYISIGNSDDKLTQREWSQYWLGVRDCINANVRVIHGEWLSSPGSSFQNACWAVEPLLAEDRYVIEFKADLCRLANLYEQDSIAWAECPETEFLTP